MHIVIVGRGMSGWITALFLRQYLPSTHRITLIGDPGLEPLRVGESTNGAVVAFLENIGVSLEQLVRDCGATVKIANAFRDWTLSGYNWIHEFQPTAYAYGLPLYHFWLLLRQRGLMQKSYQTACFHCEELLEQHRLPIDSQSGERWFPLGAHFRVPDLISLLKRRTDRLPLAIRDGRVVAVDLDESGYIHTLRLSGGEQLKTDLVVDCTGYGCVVRKLAGTDASIDLGNRLLCNSAVAAWIPRETDDVAPCTISHRCRSGWMWHIPLEGENSVGYVYSREFESEDQAAEHMVAMAALARVPNDLKTIRWQPRRLREPWFKNCVALGLSSCVLEPLESLTSSTLIFELQQLLLHFPGREPHEPLTTAYNQKVGALHESNVDFLSIIYMLATVKHGEFWREASRRDRASDRAQRLMLSFASQAPPSVSEIYDDKALFGLFSAAAIYPERSLAIASFLPANEVDAAFAAIDSRRDKISNRCLRHEDYVRAIRGA